MRPFLKDADILLTALEAEALARVPDSRLVTIEMEPLSDNTSVADLNSSIRVMKASSRVCFLQGTLFDGTVPVLKARAIFRKK